MKTLLKVMIALVAVAVPSSVPPPESVTVVEMPLVWARVERSAKCAVPLTLVSAERGAIVFAVMLSVRSCA